MLSVLFSSWVVDHPVGFVWQSVTILYFYLRNSSDCCVFIGIVGFLIPVFFIEHWSILFKRMKEIVVYQMTPLRKSWMSCMHMCHLPTETLKISHILWVRHTHCYENTQSALSHLSHHTQSSWYLSRDVPFVSYKSCLPRLFVCIWTTVMSCRLCGSSLCVPSLITTIIIQLEH